MISRGGDGKRIVNMLAKGKGNSTMGRGEGDVYH